MAELFNTKSSLSTRSGVMTFYRLDQLEKNGLTRLERLPYSIRIILEAVLRHAEAGEATRQDVINLASWEAAASVRPVMPFFAGRVLMQDFTGVPVMNDLAGMRSAMLRLGGDPRKVNPLVPVDLVIDHSVQVDYYRSPDALERNTAIEFERNHERYEFLHWCQKAFENLTVVPPSTGIVHQVNLEYLTRVALTKTKDGETVVFPDTLVGTDSHTTMINGLGIVGWGVGGIEAVGAMLGQPIEMVTPDVMGFKLTGRLKEGVTPTDLTLTIIQQLRQKGVVDKFVEFFGPGLSSLSLADRAMIANMSPESGATMIYFPVDDQTLAYLRLTGRSAELVELVETYYKTQRLFRLESDPDPVYTARLELDLASVVPSLAGPKRPQDRLSLSQVKSNFNTILTRAPSEGGYAVKADETGRKAVVNMDGHMDEIGHGAVVIAAITSCTNTSNPSVMIGAGLLAKKAIEKGLSVKPFVKTSLAPGSRVVIDYLERAGLVDSLARLGFSLVGYGCTTCIGNSGPLPDEVISAVTGANLVVSAVLSGNRNFEGRINPYTQANYLASPPLVVAYALAGTVVIDLDTEPLGTDKNGQPVFLRDIWPTSQEIQQTIHASITPEMFKQSYAGLYTGNTVWNAIESGENDQYTWSEESTYLQEPPFYAASQADTLAPGDLHGARALIVLGDSITTDHISPAGSIAASGAAGKYLLEHGVSVRDFNSYGSRRGNDRVMTRGTFGNVRIKNQLLPNVEGSFTLHLPDGAQMSIYDAAMAYKSEGVPLIVFAGKEYGTGSSRDWAAKGTLLLGAKAVIAQSFERIHRSNLAGMGVLPLTYKAGQSFQSLGLTGRETFSVEGVEHILTPGSELTVRAAREDGTVVTFQVDVHLDTANEIRYFRGGGILNSILMGLKSG